jgi:hypothetical protein
VLFADAEPPAGVGEKDVSDLPPAGRLADDETGRVGWLTVLEEERVAEASHHSQPLSTGAVFRCSQDGHARTVLPLRVEGSTTPTRAVTDRFKLEPVPPVVVVLRLQPAAMDARPVGGVSRFVIAPPGANHRRSSPTSPFEIPLRPS